MARQTRRNEIKQSINRLSVVPEDEVPPVRNRLRNQPALSLSKNRSSHKTSPIVTSSPTTLSDGNDEISSSMSSLGDPSALMDRRGVNRDLTNIKNSCMMYSSSSLQRSSSYRQAGARRHSEVHGPPFQAAQSKINVEEATPSGYSTLRGTTHDGALSPREAEEKRSAFLRYLEHQYPQHANAITGNTQNIENPLSLIRTRASYAADSYGHTSSSNESEVTRYGSLSRGGRLRSSLPIIRSRSRSRERPLGVIYLEYGGERRVAILPNELTSLDTIRALFVQAYPGLLTMPMLEPQRHSLLLKNKKTSTFDEIENISRVKDRSTIRARPTGIPTPGSKKPPAITPKSKVSAQNNQTNNKKPQHQSAENILVAEKNQKNLNQHKSGLKAPVKSLIRQYQSAPSLVKQAVVGGNGSTVEKPSSRLPHKAHDGVPKSVKNKAPPPPPRSVKPTLSPKPSLDSTQTNNGSLRSGHGLGGGSIPQKGFSYVQTNAPHGFKDESTNSEFTQNFPSPKPPNNSTNGKAVKPPSGFLSSHDSNKKNQINSPTTETFISAEDSLENSNLQSRPKTLAMQPRQYAGSPMASQTKFSPVAGQTTSQLSKPAIPKGLQPRTFSSKQQNNYRAKSEPAQSFALSNQTPLINSNSSKSSERKNYAHDSHRTSGFCKPKPSIKGHQPKPFSIPIVPDVHGDSATTNQTNAISKEDLNACAPASKSLQPESEYHKVQEKGVESDCHDLSQSSSDELSETAKTKTNSSKKGLFGLRRLVSNRSSPRPNQNLAQQNPNIEEKPNQLSTSTENSNTINVGSSNHSSSSLSHEFPPPPPLSHPRLPAPKIPEKNASKPSPVSSRKAQIPKTDLLNSLLTHKTEENKTCSPTGVSQNLASCSSDDDKEMEETQSSTSTASTPALTGVLKNSNLVKSTSSSSILTDSGASNLSATPSLRTKKVSFQDDVTVCDANGISTFSNGLRHDSVEDSFGGVYTGFESPRSYDQSLSQDASETDSYSSSNYPIRAWRNGTSNHNFPERGVYNDRLRPATPKINNNQYIGTPSYMAHQRSGYQSGVVHQSAVAAAIQSISGNPAAASAAYDRSSMVARRNHCSENNQFAVSCASSVPYVTREGQVDSYKEEWKPLRRGSRNESNVGSASLHQQGSALSVQRHAVKDVTKIGRQDESEKDSSRYEPSYFQTQGVPSVETSSEPVVSDAPPYYECCEPTKPATTTSSLAADAQKHLLAESSFPREQSYGDNKEQSSNSQEPPILPVKSGTHNLLPPSRVSAMERQLASLSGVVEAIITGSDNTFTSPLGAVPQSQASTGLSHPGPHSMTQLEMKQQLIKLRETARDLKDQLNSLKNLQRSNMEHMNDIVNEKAKDLTQFISSTAGAQHRPLRMRRARLDQERHSYAMNATSTEKQLSDVEAAVEELRNEVVERRCRVNAREVETLVLQLSQAGRTVARLKGSFPRLCDELRIVGAAETEIIYAEEKFSEAEPSRLDEQLKRCKQLTATLFTLKKLASVQEARSKTPTSFNHIRPNTPSQSQRRGAWEDDPNTHKKRMLEDVKRIRVDHTRRVESIQDAEVSWTRRRKFILEHDTKKLEKALEMAEKALNRTDYVSRIEERRRDHLIEMYKNREMERPAQESNLTTSESSSIESLPPPPPPVSHPEQGYPSSLPHGYPSYVIPGGKPSLEPALSKSPGGYGVFPTEHIYLNGSDFSNNAAKLGSGNTGSLPRHSHYSSYNQGYGSPRTTYSVSGGDNFNIHSGRHTPVHVVERSRSVTPQHWSSVAQFTDDITQGREMSEEERQQLLQQQQIKHMEKNRRLKEQYSKLQQMQKHQRKSTNKVAIGPGKNFNTGMYRAMAIAPSAKSSDV